MIFVAYVSRGILHPVTVLIFLSPNQFLGEIFSSEVVVLEESNGAPLS